MGKKITVVIKRVGKEPTVDNISNELKTFQELVGGYIEITTVPGLNDVGISVIVNEEGKLRNLEPNLDVPEINDVLVGNIIFVGTECGNEDFINLTAERIEKIKDYIDLNAFDDDSLCEIDEEELDYMDLEDQFDYLLNHDGTERKCRICGCTDYNTCEGGCYWVEDDLCSQCADKLRGRKQ